MSDELRKAAQAVIDGWDAKVDQATWMFRLGDAMHDLRMRLTGLAQAKQPSDPGFTKGCPLDGHAWSDNDSEGRSFCRRCGTRSSGSCQ